MWTGLERISEQVTRYGTVFGQLWYLTVFVFRLIVVVTIGANVYNDEQSAFRCSTKVIGCDNVCYDRFSKISHIRYWAFQLLAVSAPTLLFHFFSVRVRGQIEKYNALKKKNEEMGSTSTMASVHDERKLIKRSKSIGKVKEKQVYSTEHELVSITLTRRIQLAYYFTVVLRALTELVSLILTYKLFHFTDHTVEVYRCDGENVEWACGQHLSLGEAGYVPCWVSRPWEKTIFMCYMNFLSFLCLLFSVVEMFQLSGRVCYHWGKRRYRGLQRRKSQKITFGNGQAQRDASLLNNQYPQEHVFLPSPDYKSRPDGKQPAVGIPMREIQNKSILRNMQEKPEPAARVKAKRAKKKAEKAGKLLHAKPLGIRMLTSDPEDSESYSSDEESESDSSGLESIEAGSGDGNASY